MPSGWRLTWTSQTLRILRVSRVAPGFHYTTGQVPDISLHLVAEFGFCSFIRVSERHFRVEGPLYLTDDGKLRPAPRWATVIAVVDGARY